MGASMARRRMKDKKKKLAAAKTQETAKSGYSEQKPKTKTRGK